MSAAYVKAVWQQAHDHPGPTWLVTLQINPWVHGHIGAYPQAWAVMDDFGNLVIVSTWR